MKYKYRNQLDFEKPMDQTSKEAAMSCTKLDRLGLMSPITINSWDDFFVNP